MNPVRLIAAAAIVALSATFTTPAAPASISAAGDTTPAATAATGDIVVKAGQTVGPIKPMNGVNNGPTRPGISQQRGNFEAYKAARIPFARTHDAAFCASYGGEHTVDITAVFPDFTKDVNDPDAYDFLMTDRYLATIQEAGTEVFFRLGQKIEHGPKKYGIMPPADFQKWAEICEHVIRHYTEGWNHGFRWPIRYWEIWNEADNDTETWRTNPICWGGPAEKFDEFYAIAAKHIKKCFPHLKIGGPALCWDEDWAERFFTYQERHNVPIDFFSWHCYTNSPDYIAEKATRMRALADKHGYTSAETNLNEWNYIRNWTDEFVYSLKVISNVKGAAFISSVMSACQDRPVDILMYYDARIDTSFNGLFDLTTLAPKRGYYAIYAWSKLALLGTQVAVKEDDSDIYVTAAKGADGRLGVLISRFNEDDNVVASKKYAVKFPGNAPKGDFVNAHMTDSVHFFTEMPLFVKDGEVEFFLEPNSFIYIEF